MNHYRDREQDLIDDLSGETTRRLKEERAIDDAALARKPRADRAWVDGDDERQDDAAIDDPENGTTRLAWS